MKSRSTILTFLTALLLACLILPAARADEGMWTFDNFPSKKVEAKYGFMPSQSWLDHVRASSLRIAGGWSASFISPNGLVMTNHHCVVECVQQLSTAHQDFVETGFSAKTAAEERKCPAFELDQLVEIRNVTSEVQAALAGKTGDAANKALHAEEAKLQQSCGSNPSTRCDLVSLYHGGVYDLYRGLFHRATGAPPYALPESWLSAKSALNLDTPMNLSTTNDIISGNSGSPLINEKAEIAGLIFDGNIFVSAATTGTTR
jgi:hypothetical protein